MMLAIFKLDLSSSEKGLKISGLNWDSTPDLCDAGAVLYQLSFQTNRQLVVMGVDHEPVDDECGFIYLMSMHEFHALELRIEITCMMITTIAQALARVRLSFCAFVEDT